MKWDGLDEEHLKWIEGEACRGNTLEDSDTSWLCRKLREANKRTIQLENALRRAICMCSHKDFRPPCGWCKERTALLGG